MTNQQERIVFREGCGKFNLFLNFGRKSLVSERFKVVGAVSGIVKAQNKTSVSFFLCFGDKGEIKQT